jgi:MFS-type transporter involved in bile tolerance (Atg22 family)
MNLALAAFFLAVLAPVVSTWGDRPTAVRVGIVLFGTPFLLVALLCLSSALRPGSLGRAVRRLRRRR